MAEEVKQILIVDDHFDTLRFLRTMLEMADSRYHVVSVRSGEEAGLELHRPYDLLITDLKLPGVDGIELARRARRRAPKLPIIAVSGYPKMIAQLEESEVDIFRIYRKPLIAEDMLAAVYEAVWGEPPPSTEPEDELEAEIMDVDKIEVETAVPPEVHKRLELLRANTGAEHLMLATINGDLAAQSGILDLDLPLLAKTVAFNVKGAYKLADQLGTPEHQTIQYHTSAAYDVYTANVGEYHFITMFFDAQARRGRIGTVWVFVQRAIKDLKPLLLNAKVKKVDKPAEAAAAMPIQESTRKRKKKKPQTGKLRQEYVHAAAISREEDQIKQEGDEEAAAPAIYVPPPAVDLEPLSDEDMEKLAALSLDDLGDDSAADDFWTSAAEPAQEESITTGISLSEALQQGVIASDAIEETPLAGMVDDPTGLAPAENIPDFLKQIQPQAEPPEMEVTLDLGPLDDSDDLDMDLSALEKLGDDAPPELQALSDADRQRLANMTVDDSADSAAEIEAFWNAVVSGDTEQGMSGEGLTLDEAMQQVESLEADRAGLDAGTVDLPSDLLDLDLDDSSNAAEFWDNAVKEEGGSGIHSGLTLEEAKKQGLLSSDFGENEE